MVKTTQQPHFYLAVEMNVIELHVGVKAHMLSDGTIERSGNEHGICNMTDMPQDTDLFKSALPNLPNVLFVALIFRFSSKPADVSLLGN